MTWQIEAGLVWLLLVTEILKVHKMNLEITMANMPCLDSNCVHEQYLYMTTMVSFILRHVLY